MLIPISPPYPNSPPSVNLVEAFTYTVAESISLINFSAFSRFSVNIASECCVLYLSICLIASSIFFTVFIDKISLDLYSFTQPLNMNWKLYDEETEILGYKCKKATTSFAGRDYIAWYSTEISISDGPYKFQGLPGLIFSIYDTNNHYKFNILSLKKDNTYLDLNDELNNPLKITEKEYKELKRMYREKPTSMLNSNISFSKEDLEKLESKAKEKFKYENNPLELED